MGLFLAKNQIEALGGDLVVKSTPGIGSCFTVKF
jgi:signal transduction histidine kinase